MGNPATPLTPPERTSPGNPAVTLAWLTHPGSVVALVVLLVNDHLLKAATPGLVTGKLSDVAGLVLAPALVASVCCLLAPRLPARTVAVTSTVLVGAAFAAVKAVPGGAAVASAVWSLIRPSTILADPTDLVALPALGIAWWVWRRARTFAVPTTVARGIRAAVLLPLALLGVAATSAPSYPAVGRVVVVDGRLAVYEYDDYHGYSADRSYGPSVVTEDGLVWTEPSPSPSVSASIPSQRATSACVPELPDRCYRVVPGRLAVEETDDGGRTWRLSWEVTEGRRSFLARRYSGLRSVRESLSSVEVAVLPAADGQHLVFVANQRDGVAVRQGDGVWQRVGIPTEGRPPKPIPLTGPGRHLGFEYAMAVSLGIGLYTFGLIPVMSRRRLLAGVSAGTVLFSLMVVAAVAEPAEFPLNLVVVPVVLLITVAALASWVATVANDSRLLPWQWIVHGLPAFVAAVGVAAAFRGWSAGRPDGYLAAAGLAGAAVGVAVLITVLLIRIGRARQSAAEENPVPVLTYPAHPTEGYRRPLLRSSVPRDETPPADQPGR